MKKHTRIFALVLALAMMLMTGCGQKTYNTAQEWYDDNPMAASFMEAAAAAEDESGQMSFAIEGNAIVYRLTMDEALFGVNEEYDAQYKAYFDSYFSSAEATTTYTGIITELSDLCGVPASEMSVRIEILNPGASSPSYTKTITTAE